MQSKYCPKCETNKPISEFRKRSKNSKYIQSYCKSCESDYNKRYKIQHAKWKKENSDKQLGYSRKWKKKNQKKCYCYNTVLARNFNLTVEEFAKLYDSLYMKQQGCCVICGRHQSELNEKLGVDHNHSTGQIRGLLCNKCNTGIGMLQDSAEVCSAAAEYLRMSKADNRRIGIDNGRKPK